MSNREKTRYGHTVRDIAQDFAEHLKYSQDADLVHTTDEGRYTALALSIRDRIVHRWNQSRKTQRQGDSKRVYYLSLEFLMGRAMSNNIINLGIEEEVRQALASLGYTYEELEAVESDAGLGNGGLGRLAACFLDSLATLEIPGRSSVPMSSTPSGSADRFKSSAKGARTSSNGLPPKRSWVLPTTCRSSAMAPTR